MQIKLDRKIIACHGNQEEVIKLLQGISSNDITKISNKETIYNLFLSPNGKFLFDNFIFMKDGLVHLDCHEELSEKIISHIKKYKMRLEINFELTNLNCYSNTDEDLCIENEKYRDTRSYILGLRIYVSQEIRESDNEIEYHKFRVANNIPEGSYDIKENELFPIYFKMHELNAISLTKGCYIGQEPTNRLFRTGVMRKKLQPFTKKDFDVQSNEFGVKVTKNGEEFGILCSMYRDEFGFILASE